jgi:hypothetical protein
LLAAWVGIRAQEYDGTYLVHGPDGGIELVLRQDASGLVKGRMGDGFTVLDLRGRSNAEGITGKALGESGETLGFEAMLESDGNLHMRLFPYDAQGSPDDSVAQTLIFARQAAASAGANARPGPAEPPGGAATAREVYINRVRLDDDTVQAMEVQYRIPIGNGRYWYDALCGAWGVEGGPTAGFIFPGLNLPGPMPSDISAGGTAIFINGREIHPADQLALQQLFGYTIPGRYWLDAQGNLGPEGGPPITNLAAAMQAAQSAGQPGSVTSGYGQAGGSRGTVGGGMYSGVTASGKSVLWYPGM